MYAFNFSKILKGVALLLAVIVLPMPCLGYVIGDINSNNSVGLEEAIYSLQVVSGFIIPVSGKTINVPADMPTIQNAIDAAADGDTISVADGTYTEALTITGKSLTITGAGIGVTIIDGSKEIGIEIDHSPGVLIENLTVLNCEDGINASNHSNVEVRNTTIQGCTDRGIQIDDISIGIIADSTIKNNGGDGIGILVNSFVTLSGGVTTQNNLSDGIFVFFNSTVFMSGATYTSSGDGLGVDGGAGLSAGDNSNIFLASDSTVTINDSGTDGISIGRSSVLHTRGGEVTIEDSLANGIYLGLSSVMYSRSAITIRGSLAGAGLGVMENSTANIRGGSLLIENCNVGISVARGSIFRNQDSVNIDVNTTISNPGIDIYDNSYFLAYGGTLSIENNRVMG